MNEKDCPKCNGSGACFWEECLLCDGGRITGPWRLCEVCNATGYIDRHDVDYREQCDVCDGMCYVSQSAEVSQ